MNVTASWCGMRRSPAENFRQVMRAWWADRLLLREVPVLAVTQAGETQYGFTFGAGPLVRVLERYEQGTKSRAKAVQLGVRLVIGAVSGISRQMQPILREMEAHITVDGQRIAYDRFAAVFANVTGAINPFVEPFSSERTRDSFHFLAYATSTREFAMMAPLLARAKLPIDPRTLLHPISTWRKALLSLVGRDGLPTDPRYVNHPARTLVLETDERHYTIDGEVLPSRGGRFEVGLGPPLQVATLRARVPRSRRPEATVGA
jgi:hypothetical protein